MMYSPGEDAERTRTRALARSRSGAASIQRRPLLSTLKISNGGIMAALRWYQNTPRPICLSSAAQEAPQSRAAIERHQDPRAALVTTAQAARMPAPAGRKRADTD